MDVRVQQPLELTFKNPELTLKNTGAAPSWLQPLITGVTGLLSALVGGFIALFGGHRVSRLGLHQKANEGELAAIQSKLDSFFGPFREVAHENLLFYEELRSRQPEPETFSLLLKLLEPGWFDKQPTNDQAIVDQIIENGQTLRSLIRKRSGGVAPEIMPYLARAATHFTIIKLARGGSLNNQTTRLDAYIYPQELDSAIDAEVKRLGERQTLLRHNPGDEHKPMPSLTLPKALPAWPSRPRAPRKRSA